VAPPAVMPDVDVDLRAAAFLAGLLNHWPVVETGNEDHEAQLRIPHPGRHPFLNPSLRPACVDWCSAAVVTNWHWVAAIDWYSADERAASHASVQVRVKIALEALQAPEDQHLPPVSASALQAPPPAETAATLAPLAPDKLSRAGRGAAARNGHLSPDACTARRDPAWGKVAWVEPRNRSRQGHSESEGRVEDARDVEVPSERWRAIPPWIVLVCRVRRLPWQQKQRHSRFAL